MKGRLRSIGAVPRSGQARPQTPLDRGRHRDTGPSKWSGQFRGQFDQSRLRAELNPVATQAEDHDQHGHHPSNQGAKSPLQEEGPAIRPALRTDPEVEIYYVTLAGTPAQATVHHELSRLGRRHICGSAGVGGGVVRSDSSATPSSMALIFRSSVSRARNTTTWTSRPTSRKSTMIGFDESKRQFSSVRPSTTTSRPSALRVTARSIGQYPPLSASSRRQPSGWTDGDGFSTPG